jgi:hypothetical protein
MNKKIDSDNFYKNIFKCVILIILIIVLIILLRNKVSEKYIVSPNNPIPLLENPLSTDYAKILQVDPDNGELSVLDTNAIYNDVNTIFNNYMSNPTFNVDLEFNDTVDFNTNNIVFNTSKITFDNTEINLKDTSISIDGNSKIVGKNYSPDQTNNTTPYNYIECPGTNNGNIYFNDQGQIGYIDGANEIPFLIDGESGIITSKLSIINGSNYSLFDKFSILQILQNPEFDTTEIKSQDDSTIPNSENTSRQYIYGQ